MQQDVDFRFQDLGRAAPGAARPAPQKRGDAGPADGIPPVVEASVSAAAEVAPPPAPTAARRGGDAFDPSLDPNAPGAPKPLGTTKPSEPLPGRTTTTPRNMARSTSEASPHAPMDLMPSSLEPAPRSDVASATVSGSDPLPAAAARTASVPAGVATLAPGGTRSEYEAAFALYKDGQYDAAANGLAAFVQNYPKDRLTADATYFLGESYAHLGRHREAAEQFLKLSTDYTRSTRAPDALLRLGIALNAMGAKEQACATYQEVDRKYPTASSDVRVGVERELKRSKC
jgi:tol-pal system protein YbgF